MLHEGVPTHLVHIALGGGIPQLPEDGKRVAPSERHGYFCVLFAR